MKTTSLTEVKSNQPIEPNWIKIGSLVRRPSFVTSADAFDIADERLLARIFQQSNLRKMDQANRSLKLKFSEIWHTESRNGGARLDKAFDKMWERLQKCSWLHLGPEASSVLGYNDARITWIEVLDKGMDLETNQPVITIKFTEEFFKLMIKTLNNKINPELLVSTEVELFFKTQNAAAARFYYAIAHAQMTTNQMVLSVKDFLQLAGSKANPESAIWRINQRVVKPIQQALAGTHAAFAFRTQLDRKNKTDYYIFYFKSNEQIQNEDIAVSGTNPKFEFEKCLKILRVNENLIFDARKRVSDNALPEEYVNYVITKSVEYLLNKETQGNRQHNPAGLYREAMDQKWFLKEFEGLKKAGMTGFYLPDPMPSYEQLVKGGKPTAVKNGISNNKRKDAFAVKQLFRAAFGSSDEHLLSFIIREDDEINEKLLGMLKGKSNPEVIKGVFMHCIVALCQKKYSKEISEIVNKSFSEIQLIKNPTTIEVFWNAFIGLFIEQEGKFDAVQISSLKTLINSQQAA
ncbi:MAG: hypothetical protein ABJH04_07275 [Cyclobacteriaceae bacterium]